MTEEKRRRVGVSGGVADRSEARSVRGAKVCGTKEDLLFSVSLRLRRLALTFFFFFVFFCFSFHSYWLKGKGGEIIVCKHTLEDLTCIYTQTQWGKMEKTGVRQL